MNTVRRRATLSVVELSSYKVCEGRLICQSPFLCALAFFSRGWDAGGCFLHCWFADFFRLLVREGVVLQKNAG